MPEVVEIEAVVGLDSGILIPDSGFSPRVDPATTKVGKATNKRRARCFSVYGAQN